MAEHESRPRFGERLQAQETRVGEDKLADYRRKLDERFALAARRERRMRIALFIILGMVALGILLSMISSAALSALFPKVHLGELMEENTAALIAGTILMVVFAGSGFSLPPLLLLYFLRYRRNLQQVQQDQVLAAVIDLQREVAELRARLGGPPERAGEREPEERA
jgi:hypothetical protein